VRRRISLTILSFALVLPIVWQQPAPASVEEQIARLPPAATACGDDVEGTWLAFVYVPHLGEWYRDTLHIHRAGSALTGDVDAEAWRGDATNVEPRACTPGYTHFIVHEPSEGSFADGEIDFRATSWGVAAAPCAGPSDYVLDEFKGELDRARQEFVSVNAYNFGARHYEDPMLFRRISCDATSAPASVAPPPPDAPDHSLKCGCRPRR
jgi:hypothetical protein